MTAGVSSTAIAMLARDNEVTLFHDGDDSHKPIGAS